MRTVLVVLMAAMPLLAGCLVPDAPFGAGASPQKLAGSPSGPPRAAATAPVFSVPHSAPPGPGEGQPAAPAAPVAPPGSPSTAAPGDTCGAAALAYLVGKPRTEIPIPADLTRRRVVCTTCPVDAEVRPDRQTITYDTATKLVTKVACG